jgi:hypothetical protein
VERHQEHTRRDADTLGPGRYRRRRREDRRKISVVDEVMLGQPNVIEAVVLAPGDLVENLAVEPVGGLTPLLRVSEIIPKAEANFSSVAHDDFS